VFGKRRIWRAPRRKLDRAKLIKLRLWVLRALVLAAFIALGIQLWRLQIIRGDDYRTRAEHNSLRVVTLPAKRGVIYDRNGIQLVQNVPSFSAAVVPVDVPEGKEDELCARLAKLLDVPAWHVALQLENARSEQRIFTPMVIKSQLDEDTALILEEHRDELPGFRLLVEPARKYPEGEVAAHLLGYVGRISLDEYRRLKDSGYELNDRLGKMGVELSYERELRGEPGWQQVEVDASGEPLRVLRGQAAKPGSNLVLTIDIDLQRKMTEYLSEGIAERKSAVAIAMDPRNGEILGMASLPSYDNNIFSGNLSEEELNKLLEDPSHPLINRAVAAAYPPGSCFKLVTACAALSEGVATPNTHIVSTGSIQAGNQVMRDWKALGDLDFYQAIALSSDVYFYYLAGGYEGFRGLGPDRLANYARAFGFGAPTGVGLPGESSGLVPDTKWKWKTLKEQWYIGETYNYGIGQGFLSVTPLQLVSAVSAIANGGTRVQPHVLRELRDAAGSTTALFWQKGRRVPVTPNDVQTVREGMRQAVEWGTATKGQVPGVTVAGKTGTAEFGEKDPETGEYQTHGWFVAFAPYDNPEIAVVVFQENGGGYETASEIAGKILSYYFYRDNPPNPAPSAGPLTAMAREEGGAP